MVDTNEENYEKDSNKNLKDTSGILWTLLWGSTIVHAGSTVWAILSTAKLPPGYELGPNWVTVFGNGPTSQTFWFYVVVLAINVIWESWLRGQKSYVPPTPFPNIKYSHVALISWAILWIAGHVGNGDGVTYPVPDWLNKTFVVCILLWIFQHLMIRFFQKFDEIKKAFMEGSSPAKPNSSQPTAQAAGNGTLNQGQSSALPAQNQAISNNADLTAKVLDYVRQKGQAKTSGLVGILGSSRRSVIRTLNKLLADGKLIREGNGAGAVYRLNENPKDGKWN